MRPSLKRLIHYRPRFLTLVVFAAVAAVLILANLSEEARRRRWPSPSAKDVADFEAHLTFDVRESLEDDRSYIGLFSVSYGWPLLWRQYVIIYGYGARVYGDVYSAGRLAGNVAMWLVMVIAPVATCEWLLRRYRPRLRWSLRTMLIAVGLVAACCGWFVAARNRAAIDDQLIAVIEGLNGDAWFERWGPNWLEVVGADPLCRRLIGADLGQGDDEEIEDLLQRLARLCNLQYLTVSVDEWTPQMTKAVGEMRQLRTLNLTIAGIDDTPPKIERQLADVLRNKPGFRAISIDLGGWYEPEQTTPGFLAAIGNITQLEALRRTDATIDIESLQNLAGLTNLRSLTLDGVVLAVDDPAHAPSFLSSLPALPRLEALELHDFDIGDRDFAFLARLPKLKSLNLIGTRITEAGLVELGSPVSLEELALDNETVTAESVAPLRASKRLATLRIQGFYGTSITGIALRRDQLPYVARARIVGCLEALEALRKSKPELVIRGGTREQSWSERAMIPSQYDPLHRRRPWGIRYVLRQWQEEQAKKRATSGPN